MLVASIVACKSEGTEIDQTSKDRTHNPTSDSSKDNKEQSRRKTNTETKANTKSEVVSNFLSNINTLKSVEDQNPITAFQKLAENEANEVFDLSKDNIKDVISSAKGYKNLVITTGDHTIVNITDVNNCKQSGAWGACMPYGTGFIKKGDLILKEDYVNNIIGIPDSQVRKAYLFN